MTSFPAGFKLEGSFHKKWARVGNCVPPLFMRAIAQHIRKEILPRMGDSRERYIVLADEAASAAASGASTPTPPRPPTSSLV
jgi:hypothetical protein